MNTPQNSNQPREEMPFMNSMTSIVNKAVKEGYVDSFKITGQGLYSCGKDHYYTPQQVNVINYYRFEGPSDPGDNSILYVIETEDGAKGTLIDAYGPYADGRVNAFMDQVGTYKKMPHEKDKAYKPD